MSKQNNTQSSQNMPPQLALWPMISAYYVPQLIYVAAKLGIADMLKDGVKNCDELATATAANARALYRLMRALASVGVFAEKEQGYFALTPVAVYLQSDIPDSIRWAAIMFAEEQYKAWGELLYSIKTGASAFEYLYGMELYEYYAQNPEPGEIFHKAMTSIAITREDAAIATGYDFSSIKTLVDIGGGRGSTIAEILKANPTMKGVLFDCAPALESAKDLIEAEGVSQRCKFTVGDFFESVPSGCDAYILKRILHDWDDERAITILKNCHRAMAKNGKILVAERLIPLGNEPYAGKLIDLDMLVMTGGSERTESECRSLFERAGFQVTKIVSIQSDMSLIEGIPV
ncbi:MAG: methyltransferase [Nostoc sp.]